MTDDSFTSGPNQKIAEEIIEVEHEEFRGGRIGANTDENPDNERLKFWHDEVIRLNRQKEDEAIDLAARKQQPRYIELQDMINQASAEQAAMLAGLPDSEPELEKAKESMMMEMKARGLTTYLSIYAMMGKKKTVNASRLLNVLGGDIGIFMEMAKVTQKQLKDFAEIQPHIEKELMSCIDIEGVMKDIEIGFNFSRP